VKLRVWEIVVLFVLGAVASLIGDHAHVSTGTTEYFTKAVPFIWSSPIWFPVMVAAATVSIAELRLHMSAPQRVVTWRQGVAGVAAVLGIYVTTALFHMAPSMPSNVLIYAMAIITWCALGDGAGALCGLIAAVVGPIVEAVIVGLGVFRYAYDSDQLFGVGPWLPALYFAFGVVVALLAEIAVALRRPTTTSANGTPGRTPGG
jgi:hypothetical protein